MTVTVNSTAPRHPAPNAWTPEDPVFWADTGAATARRNLVVSVLTEHLAFSVWSLWSVFVLFMGPKYHVSTAQKFLLTSLPTAVGAVARLPYTAAVARFGGRTWTVISGLLLLIPTAAAAIAVHPGTSFLTFLIVAALAGFGGGNFASSTANIDGFYPQRMKGRVLGINAGGGNVGVAVVQLVGLAVLAGAGQGHPRLILAVYIPLLVAGAILAACFMDNIPHTGNGPHALRDALKDGHTWLISLLYMGTFGTFIGFSFAFGQVLQVQFRAQFDTPVKAAYLTFLGPLIGSLIRPVGGWLADRLGGGRVTIVTFAGMAAGAAVVLAASMHQSLGLFVAGFVILFALSGLGNGSTYKMIPSIHAGRSDARRRTRALLGIAGAVGAFGGVLVNLAFRQAFVDHHTGNLAYEVFIGFYAVCAVVTVCNYRDEGRPALAAHSAPSPL